MGRRVVGGGEEGLHGVFLSEGTSRVDKFRIACRNELDLKRTVSALSARSRRLLSVFWTGVRAPSG